MIGPVNSPKELSAPCRDPRSQVPETPRWNADQGASEFQVMAMPSFSGTRALNPSMSSADRVSSMFERTAVVEAT